MKTSLQYDSDVTDEGLSLAMNDPLFGGLRWDLVRKRLFPMKTPREIAVATVKKLYPELEASLEQLEKSKNAEVRAGAESMRKRRDECIAIVEAAIAEAKK